MAIGSGLGSPGRICQRVRLAARSSPPPSSPAPRRIWRTVNRNPPRYGYRRWEPGRARRPFPWKTTTYGPGAMTFRPSGRSGPACYRPSPRHIRVGVDVDPAYTQTQYPWATTTVKVLTPGRNGALYRTGAAASHTIRREGHQRRVHLRGERDRFRDGQLRRERFDDAQGWRPRPTCRQRVPRQVDGRETGTIRRRPPSPGNPVGRRRGPGDGHERLHQAEASG